jgi:hypothetical protein
MMMNMSINFMSCKIGEVFPLAIRVLKLEIDLSIDISISLAITDLILVKG